jgi:hypothetical protein
VVSREALKFNEILRNAPTAVDMDLTHQREAGEYVQDMTSEPARAPDSIGVLVLATQL